MSICNLYIYKSLNSASWICSNYLISTRSICCMIVSIAINSTACCFPFKIARYRLIMSIISLCSKLDRLTTCYLCIIWSNLNGRNLIAITFFYSYSSSSTWIMIAYFYSKVVTWIAIIAIAIIIVIITLYLVYWLYGLNKLRLRVLKNPLEKVR